MGREDFVAVGARLFALYLVFLILRSIPSAADAISASRNPSLIYAYAAFMVLALSLVACVWFFPLTIARKLLPAMHEPRSERAMDAPAALTVGITLIGLWFLAGAATELLYWSTLLVLFRQPELAGASLTGPQQASIAAALAQLALALWFVLGSSGIRRTLLRLRHGAERGSPLRPEGNEDSSSN